MRVVSRSQGVRPPAVAGRFYPGEPDQLESEVSRLLDHAAGAAAGVPKALIAPHAGYVYSGCVAAAAFATLRHRAHTIERVVLVGPAHYVHLTGIAVPTAAAFEMPLGRVPVDHGVLGAIADLPFVLRSDAPHIPEHALEVELPFLQTMLPAFRMVPLMVGDVAVEHVAMVLSRLWGGPETLIVISSHLSHFRDYETARRLDKATADAIERGDGTGLGADQTCGYLAVAGLLREASRRGLKRRRLALCNSGDTAESRDSVVGYGAWMFE